MSDKDLYIGWLKDAHSLEHTLISALENHIKDAKDFPELQSGLQMHLEQTRRHEQLVKDCIERNGGSTSALKTGITGLGGQLKNMLNAGNQDEVVKNTLDDYVAENLEIACYTSLISAAEQVGDMQAVPVFRQILQDEEMAAQKVMSAIPIVTRAALTRKATADTR